MKNFIKIKLIELLGLKHLYTEVQELRGMIEEVDYKADEIKDDLQNVEYRCDEVETETERLCDNIDDEMHNKFEQAYEELQEHIQSFNEMKEGYVLDVKITKAGNMEVY